MIHLRLLTPYAHPYYILLLKTVQVHFDLHHVIGYVSITLTNTRKWPFIAVIPQQMLLKK